MDKQYNCHREHYYANLGCHLRPSRGNCPYGCSEASYGDGMRYRRNGNQFGFASIQMLHEQEQQCSPSDKLRNPPSNKSETHPATSQKPTQQQAQKPTQQQAQKPTQQQVRNPPSNKSETHPATSQKPTQQQVRKTETHPANKSEPPPPPHNYVLSTGKFF